MDCFSNVYKTFLEKNNFSQIFIFLFKGNLVTKTICTIVFIKILIILMLLSKFQRKQLFFSFFFKFTMKKGEILPKRLVSNNCVLDCFFKDLYFLIYIYIVLFYFFLILLHLHKYSHSLDDLKIEFIHKFKVFKFLENHIKRKIFHIIVYFRCSDFND